MQETKKMYRTPHEKILEAKNDMGVNKHRYWLEMVEE